MMNIELDGRVGSETYLGTTYYTIWPRPYHHLVIGILFYCADRRHHLVGKGADRRALKPPANTGGTSGRPSQRPPCQPRVGWVSSRAVAAQLRSPWQSRRVPSPLVATVPPAWCPLQPCGCVTKIDLSPIRARNQRDAGQHHFV